MTLERNPRTLGETMIRVISGQRIIALVLLVLFFCLAFSIVFPNTFGTLDNFALILLNMSSEAMILIAISLVLIMGEIDLSLGAVMALSGILCGRFMIRNELPTLASIVLPLLLCLLCGLLNGFIVSKLQVVSFIGTLATGMMYLGVAVMLAGTGWTDFPDPLFKFLGQSVFFGLRLPVWYMFFFVGVFSLLVSQTRFFRQLYYVGGNQKAARLSGIDIPKTKTVVFILASLLAGIGGIVTAMRFNTSMPNVGAGVELRAVTAAVIGGVSFTGGTGTILGAAVGALFVACLNNALTIARVSPDIQFCITGLILIGAIVLDNVVKRRGRR